MHLGHVVLGRVRIARILVFLSTHASMHVDVHKTRRFQERLLNHPHKRLMLLMLVVLLMLVSLFGLRYFTA